MEIICFRGKGDTGKSTIIQRILNEFFNITLIPKKKKDFCLIFPYKTKMIGICSDGDKPSVLEKLEELKNEGCEILICASRTKGELFEGIYQMDKNVKPIICLGKKKSPKWFKVKENKKRIREFKRIFNAYF